MVRIPEGSTFFFQYLISFSFWSMAKYLEYPIATQEVAGSNPRILKFLNNFSFRYSSKAGESI